jgi:HSP20 family protein
MKVRLTTAASLLTLLLAVTRAFGHFQRVIPLPAGIDLDRAEAKLENGILTARLPKAAGEATAKRRIDIK